MKYKPKLPPKDRAKMREHLKNSPKVMSLIDDVEALEKLFNFARRALKTSATQGSLFAIGVLAELERMEGAG